MSPKVTQMAKERFLTDRPVETDIDHYKLRECVGKILSKHFVPNARDVIGLFLKDSHLTVKFDVDVDVDFLTVDFTAVSTARRGIPLITPFQRDAIRTYMLGEFTDSMNKLYLKTLLANMLASSDVGHRLNAKLVQVRACGRYCSQVPVHQYKWSIHPLY